MRKTQFKNVVENEKSTSETDESILFRMGVRVIAETDSEDPEVINEALAKIGTTLAELSAAAERLKTDLVEAVFEEQKRGEWLEDFGRLQEVQPELLEVQEQLGAVQAEFEVAKQKYETLAKPLRIRRDELNDVCSRAIQARTRLANCPPAEIKARTEPIRKKMIEAGKVKRAAKEVLKDAEALLRAARQKPEHKRSQTELDRLTERVQIAQARVDAAQEAYNALDRQFTEIDRQKFEPPKPVEPQAVETVETGELELSEAK